MASELPAEQRASYAAIIDEILANADLETISAKRIRNGLQERVDYDLTPQKDAIKALIMERFDKAQNDTPATAPEPEPAPTANGRNHEDDEESSPKKRKAGSGHEESDLSDVADSPPPKKVKKKSKPEAESDEAFARNLQAEINGEKRATRGGGAATRKKPAAKQAKKPKKKSSTKISAADDSDLASGSEKPEKEKKGGFHKLMALSEPLSAMLGEPALSRPQTVKQIWAYVKERDLQDPNDKRQIRCDEKMHAVFKQDRVHMFTMNKLLATHLHPMEEE